MISCLYSDTRGRFTFTPVVIWREILANLDVNSIRLDRLMVLTRDFGVAQHLQASKIQLQTEISQ